MPREGYLRGIYMSAYTQNDQNLLIHTNTQQCRANCRLLVATTPMMTRINRGGEGGKEQQAAAATAAAGRERG